ncbi:MAG: hypothetical protein R3E91_02475 [Chlamydiales bacterium]
MVFRLKIVFTIILLCVLSLGFYAYNWQSPDVNQSASSNLHQCIYKSDDKSNLKVISLNNEFVITYVENSDHDCFNPYFPAIHITTQAKHNAWLHVVYTDRNDIKDNQIFVDTDKAPDIYPFYNLGQEFYDAPLWRYSLFSKPLSYWKGHAWAVEVDHENKTIKPVGGVSWGFNLSYFQIRLICITPSALNEDDWVNDWQIFKMKLSEFKNG